MRKIIQLSLFGIFLVLSMAAVNAARLPVVGSDKNIHGNILLDYLLVSHDQNGTLRNTSILGTGEIVFSVDGTTNNVGVGTTTPAEKLSVVGNLSATSDIFMRGKIVQQEATAFKASNFTGNYDARSDRFSVGNFTSIISTYLTSFFSNGNWTVLYDGRADRYGNSNFTAQYDSRADRFGNVNFTALYSTEYAATGYKKSNFTSDLGTSLEPAFNLGNYSAEYALTGYKLTNFTGNYDARLDRYSKANLTGDLASSGFTLGGDVSIVGELNVTGVSADGVGKVVCIKSNKQLGTCQNATGSDGTCNCA